MTALILGPQTDNLLSALSEDLKGKTILVEPYVDKKTIVRAVSEQNGILRTIQSQFLNSVERLRAVEDAFVEQDKVVKHLKKKVDEFEIVAQKVEVIESTIESWRSKMDLVDYLVEEVANHDSRITEISTELNNQATELSSFKSEMKSTLSDIKTDINSLHDDVSDLPNTIQITSNQVNMPNNNDKLTNVMLLHEGRTNLLEETCRTLTDTTETHAAVVSRVTTQLEPETAFLRENVTSLSQWKEEQSSVDLVTLRRDQDGVLESVATMRRDLSDRVSRDEMTSSLQSTFDEIIDHLQTALVSTEKDEADFKAVTQNLNRMFESLRDDKADKRDIVALRKQFIEHRVEVLAPSGGANVISGGGGAVLGNEELRALLSQYATKQELEKALSDKADEKAARARMDRAETVVNGIQSTVNDVLAMARSASEKHMKTVWGDNVSTDTGNSSDDAGGGGADNHKRKSFLLTETPITSKGTNRDNQISNEHCSDNNQLSSSSRTGSSSDLSQTNSNSTVTKATTTPQPEQHFVVQLPQIASHTQIPRQRRLSAGDADELHNLTVNNDQQRDVIDARAPPSHRRAQQKQKEITVHIAAGIRLPGTKARGGRVERPRSDANNAKVTAQTIEFPIINRDRMRLNPNVSYGGGYQLNNHIANANSAASATAVAPSKKRAAGNSDSSSSSALSLRGLDQYQKVLPVVEKKKMVMGADGKYYVSSRQVGNDNVETDTLLPSQQKTTTPTPTHLNGKKGNTKVI